MQLLHNMLSKLVKEDKDFPPKKKAKSGLGYAAKWKMWAISLFIIIIFKT